MRQDAKHAVAKRITAAVRRLRKERGWSQLELAERANLSINYIGLIERTGRLPNIDVLFHLASVLGTTFEVLVGATEPAEEDPWIAEATTILRALPHESRPVVLAMLRGVLDAGAPSKPAKTPRRPRARAVGRAASPG